jgi:mRNA-degrading endonuclease toxin of MazEF toxin-antitoxin module
VTHQRGEVWFVDIPDVGDKPALIVSWDVVSTALDNAVVARITSVPRQRSVPTVVPLEVGEVEGLDRASWIVCHDLFTLPKPFRRLAGSLRRERMLEVDAALRRALDL